MKRLWHFLLLSLAVVPVPLACGGGGDGDTEHSGGSGSGANTSSGGTTPGDGGASTGSQAASGGATSSGGAFSAGGAVSTGGGMGGLGGVTGDFFPEDLWVTTPADGCWKLSLTAFTLQESDSGFEFLAAVRNDGDEVTCAVQVAVELFDASDVSLAAVINTVKHPSHHLYSIDAETQAIVDCLAPGEIAMGRLVDFPPDLELEDVARLNYRCPSLKLAVDAPVDAASVTAVEAVTTEDGTVYTGVFENELELPLSHPFVVVFPTTASGRPLGMTIIESEADVLAGGTWNFETPPVDVAGDAHAVFFSFDNPL